MPQYALEIQKVNTSIFSTVTISWKRIATQLCYEKCTELQTDLLLFDGKSFTENGISLEFNPKYDRTGFFTKSVSTGLETIETHV